jgi:hypothetical protein
MRRGLWCRAMSLTPIYDQLRGERINVDLPATDVPAPDLFITEHDPMPAPRRTATGQTADLTPLFRRS